MDYLFNLVAKITIDTTDYNKNLKNAEKRIFSTESKLKSFGNAAKTVWSGVKKAAKVTTAAVGAAETAIVAFGKKSISAYAEYEQLVGGVETLFKENADLVIKNANRAFETVGMSANEYMDTVTQFSGALLRSVGNDTEKAAKYADMALQDMADNANKFGTSLEMVESAYLGMSRGIYSTFDNLKLGYAGTQKGVYELLQDAAKLDEQFAKTAKFSMDTKGHLEAGYDVIVQGIHIIQQNMGIAGTTVDEAGRTIQGSLKAVSAAWQNIVIGITDDTADLDQLFQNFFNSLEAAGKNLIPRLSKVLTGVSSLVSGLLPQLAEEIPGLLDQLLPGLVSGAVGLMNSLVVSLPKILQPLLDATPELLTGLEQVFVSIVTMLPQLLDIIVTAIPQLAPQIISGAVSVISILAENSNEIMQPIVESIPQILDILVSSFITNLPTYLKAVGEFWMAYINAKGTFLYELLIKPILESFEQLWNDLKPIFDKVVGFFSNAWDEVKNAFGKAAKWVYDTIIEPVANFFTGLWEKIVSAFHTVIDPWIEIIKRASKIVYDKIIKPVLDYFKKLWDDIVAIWETVSGWFSEHVIEPVKKLFSDIWDSVKEKASEAWEGIKNVFKPVADWFNNTFSEAWQKVKDVFSTGGKVFDGIKEGIVSSFKTVVNTIIKGINKIIAVPFKKINEILQKIHDVEILGVSPFTYIHQFEIPEIPLLAKGGIAKRPVIAGEAGAEAIIPLEHNTEWIQNVAKQLELSSSNSEEVKLMRSMLNEMQSMRKDMYSIILAALKTNSDEFNGSERDLIRLVKKYAYA